MVPYIKPVDKPHDLVHSPHGIDLVVSVKPTVEIPTRGDDTRYEFVCLDSRLDPGGSPSRAMPRCDEDIPVNQMNKPASVAWNDPENDVV